MINTLRISRFKSIKDLSLDCKRVNIFIGQPNTGKSNILEALGMLSFMPYEFGSQAAHFVRFERTANLFYDESLEHPLHISCNGLSFSLAFKDGRFDGQCLYGQEPAASLIGDHSTLRIASFGPGRKELHPFKLYRFSVLSTFTRTESDFLLPPSGQNLLSLLLTNRELRAVANQPFASMGLRLGLRPQEQKIEIIKHLEDVVVSYPYSLASETLQRLTFYLAAILTNKDSVLVFEEPEAHAFPYYTNRLAELIALDQNGNQYFISTHNPYFLLPLVAKVPKGELAVYITYFENYETKVRKLKEKDLQELGEIDIFSNLDRYLKRR